jgi:hypothetical protein
MDEHSSLFSLSVIEEGKKFFIILTIGVNVIKPFFFVTDCGTKKLECLSQESFIPVHIDIIKLVGRKLGRVFNSSCAYVFVYDMFHA